MIKDSPDILSSEAIQKQRKSSSSSESGESTDLESVGVEKETNNAVELVDAVSSASAIKDRKRQRDDVKYFGLSDTEREKDAVNRDGESAMTDEFMEEVDFSSLGFEYLSVLIIDTYYSRFFIPELVTEVSQSVALK